MSLTETLLFFFFFFDDYPITKMSLEMVRAFSDFSAAVEWAIPKGGSDMDVGVSHFVNNG